MTDINCPAIHECGEAVSLDLGGFSATSATVGACSEMRADGIRSYTVRKSEALGFSPAASQALVHKDGLVVLA